MSTGRRLAFQFGTTLVSLTSAPEAIAPTASCGRWVRSPKYAGAMPPRLASWIVPVALLGLLSACDSQSSSNHVAPTPPTTLAPRTTTTLPASWCAYFPDYCATPEQMPAFRKFFDENTYEILGATPKEATCLASVVTADSLPFNSAERANAERKCGSSARIRAIAHITHVRRWSG
jgi:hypothetical protein